MAHIKSWKVLRKSFGAALITAASLFSLPWTDGEIYTAPFDLEFPVLSLFLKKKKLHRECSVSLKTYAFVVWNHYSPCWVTVKEKQFRKIEGSMEKVRFSQMKFGAIWWAAFIILTSWKNGGSGGADIVINPARLHSKFPTLMSKLGNQLKPLLERQSDETALQLRAGLLFLSLGSFHERKRSCRRG